MTHTHKTPSLKTLYFCLAINIIFVVVEAVVGWRSNSTGLLSDAGHNLSDVLGLALSLVAVLLERSNGGTEQRVSKYVTLANGLLLLVAVAIITIESVSKIVAPQVVDGDAVICTSLVAIVINGLTALLLMRGEDGNINIKVAYLHAASDALVSVGVVISGVVVLLTGWNVVDALVGLVISVVIVIPTAKLLASTINSIKNS